MIEGGRVVWSEGMFLRPQHFQQADRFAEALVDGRARPLAPYPWGFTRLRLDPALLNLGQVGIAEAAGILEDGTPFRIPEDAPAPRPIEIARDQRDLGIYLALPTRRPGGTDIAMAADDVAITRYLMRERDVRDAIAGAESDAAALQLAELRCLLLHEREERAGYATLPLARVVERRVDGSLVLDTGFIPTAMACAASSQLTGYVTELMGMLTQRANAISARLGRGQVSSVAETQDFLILQLANRHEPLIRHFAELPDLHPEMLYRVMVGLAGELGTFTSRDNRPPPLPAYHHRDLAATFHPLMSVLREQLNAVFEQTAIPIKLELRQFGIRVGKITDKSLFEDSDFVLAVRAAADPEALRVNMPKRTTIGAVERIRDLVNLQLVGVPIRPLATEPRQIPFRPGVTYFAVNTHSEQWATIRSSGGIAIHVAGDVPDLDLELWAIRGQAR